MNEKILETINKISKRLTVIENKLNEYGWTDSTTIGDDVYMGFGEDNEYQTISGFQAKQMADRLNIPKNNTITRIGNLFYLYDTKTNKLYSSNSKYGLDKLTEIKTDKIHYFD